MVFADFDDSAYDVQTTMEMGGQAVAAPFTPPAVVAGNVPMDVTCDGDVLTTHPQGSPFTTRGTRTA